MRPRSFGSVVEEMDVHVSASRSSAMDYGIVAMGMGESSSGSQIQVPESAYQFHFKVEDYSLGRSSHRTERDPKSCVASKAGPANSSLSQIQAQDLSFSAGIRPEALTPMRPAVLTPPAPSTPSISLATATAFATVGGPNSPEMPGAFGASPSPRRGPRLRMGEVRVSMARVEPRVVDLGAFGFGPKAADHGNKERGVFGLGLGLDLSFGFMKSGLRNRIKANTAAESIQQRNELYNLPPLASMSSLDLPSLATSPILPSAYASPRTPDSPYAFPVSPSLVSPELGSPDLGRDDGPPGLSPSRSPFLRNLHHARVQEHIPFSLIPPPTSVTSVPPSPAVSILDRPVISPSSSSSSFSLPIPGGFKEDSAHRDSPRQGQGGLLARFRSLNALALSTATPARPSPLRRVVSLRSFGSGSARSSPAKSSPTKSGLMKASPHKSVMVDVSWIKAKSQAVEESFEISDMLVEQSSNVDLLRDSSVRLASDNGVEVDKHDTSAWPLDLELELAGASAVSRTGDSCRGPGLPESVKAEVEDGDEIASPTIAADAVVASGSTPSFELRRAANVEVHERSAGGVSAVRRR